MLTAGEYTLRLTTPNGGFNLNWFKLTPTDEMPTGDIGTGSDTVLNVGEIISFNDMIVDYDLVDFGNNLSGITADPENSSNSVVSTTKGSDAAAGTTVASGQIIYPLSSTLTRISMRVYSSQAGIPVRMKLEESADSSRSVEAEALTTVANEWEVLIFDFSSPVAGSPELNASYSYDKLSVFFDYGSAGSGEIYYWDDVTFLDVYVPPVTMTANCWSVTGSWLRRPEPLVLATPRAAWLTGQLIVARYPFAPVCLTISSALLPRAGSRILWVTRPGLRAGRAMNLRAVQPCGTP